MFLKFYLKRFFNNVYREPNKPKIRGLLLRINTVSQVSKLFNSLAQKKSQCRVTKRYRSPKREFLRHSTRSMHHIASPVSRLYGDYIIVVQNIILTGNRIVLSRSEEQAVTKKSTQKSNTCMKHSNHNINLQVCSQARTRKLTIQFSCSPVVLA